MKNRSSFYRVAIEKLSQLFTNSIYQFVKGKIVFKVKFAYLLKEIFEEEFYSNIHLKRALEHLTKTFPSYSVV